MFLPEFLHKGDTVALIAPSGPQPPEKLSDIASSVLEFGLKPMLFPSCEKKHGYLAGTDKERARDLTDAFALPEIKAVICVRGGYGAHRLLEYVDFDAIAASRKPLYGYSDITALHMEINRRGVVSWHTPMPGTEWYKGLDSFTKNSVKAALFGPMPEKLINPEGDGAIRTLIPGKAEGPVCGGNLSLVSASIGTFYEIDTKDRILFLEDVDESPYHIDRMLLQLRHAGKFKDCAGVVFGSFTDCEPRDAEMSLTIEEVINELIGDICRPVVTGFQCGHILPTICVPLGSRVLLDADKAEMRVLGV
ncbi:MAG: LD-carboxypeptidase [Clostridiales bacterium]|nr:LD-carboxypeptidase [Clostridiales bacterium]